MKPGIYPSLTNEEYHADSAISRSGMILFDSSPYKYWAEHLNPSRPPKESTPAMEFGTAFHTFILEPHLFESDYAVEPEKVLLKDVGREEYDAYKAEVALLEFSKKTVVSRTDYELLVSMREALKKNGQAWELIQDATYECSLFWKDKDSQIDIKARPDIWHQDIIVDLKTCASAESRAYQHTMIESGYHIQGAIIREGIRQLTGHDIPNVINICIEKKYPYSIGIKIISENALEEGHRKFKEILMNMRSAFDNNHFPDLEIDLIELPYWY